MKDFPIKVKGSRQERILLTPEPLEILEIEKDGLASIKWRWVGSEVLTVVGNGCAEEFFNSISPEGDREVLFYHLRNLAELPGEKRKGMFFLNVKPQTLLLYHRDIDGEIERLGLDRRHIVFEVREEHLSEVDMKSLSLLKNDYRLSYAIDDFGVASSNVDRVSEMAPEFVKLDLRVFKTAGALVHVSYLIREIHPGVRLIAEKVETVRDLERTVIAGIRLWQGFLERRLLSSESQAQRSS